jgi:uncharacterized protein (DUF433 family)
MANKAVQESITRTLVAESPDGNRPQPSPGLVREDRGGESYEYYPLGEYVVAASSVCRGRPTFKYTRIDVAFILGRLGAGETIEELVAAYRGKLSREGLEEALRLAGTHPPQFFQQSYVPPDLMR